MNKRLLWVSLFLHILLLGFVGFFNKSSQIRKTFLAYGHHSKKMSLAFFRQFKKPSGSGYWHAKRQAELRKAAADRKRRAQARRKRAAERKKQLAAKRRAEAARKKALAAKKAAAKKAAAKKKSVIPQKPQPKKRVVPQKKKTPEKKKVEDEPSKEEVAEEPEDDEEVLHFNLMGETDPRIMMYQGYIQQEVDRVWRPPLGVPKGTECLVNFVIDKSGKVKAFEIVKRSKVLIYDLSVIRVAKTFAFDRCLWGKRFTINFRQ